MIKIIVCLVIGFFIGTILTTILLCQKNLEQYQKIRVNAEKEMENGKKIYKNQLSIEDDFENQVNVMTEILKNLYEEENKSDYKKAVLDIYDVLEPFCADEESEVKNNG